MNSGALILILIPALDKALIKALKQALIKALKQALILMILNSALNPVHPSGFSAASLCPGNSQGRLFAWFAHMRFKLQKAKTASPAILSDTRRSPRPVYI